MTEASKPHAVRILGISASLRAARFGKGGQKLIREIADIADRKALTRFLAAQGKIVLDEFFHANHRDGQPFTELYYALRKAKGDRGLCNSEAALVAGLWGAHQCGSDIAYAALINHFPPAGGVKDSDKLRISICSADGILLAGPVYFGDRGSLAQRFFEFLHADADCRRHIEGKAFAGITVGAKRNGGQETTLIYQLIDAVNLKMLGVGNDFETTAQYGGTGVAGDVGTLPGDDYGLATIISTGRRLSQASSLLARGKQLPAVRRPRIGVWLLQDDALGRGRTYAKALFEEVSRAEEAEIDLFDLTSETVHPCIGCEICPVSVGQPEEYRCIVKNKDDLFFRHHARLIDADAVILAAYSPCDRSSIKSVYQTFIERTRYLRRDDYRLADRLVAPLVITEVGANQNLHIRMLTSAIRHHTVLHQPLIGVEHEGRLLNKEQLVHKVRDFVRMARVVTNGRLLQERTRQDMLYNPVGYIVSAEKHRHDIREGLRPVARRTAVPSTK